MSEIDQWKKENPLRVRKNLRRWYYFNRTYINMMFSKAKGIEPDIADQWYAEHHPEG